MLHPNCCPMGMTIFIGWRWWYRVAIFLYGIEITMIGSSSVIVNVVGSIASGAFDGRWGWKRVSIKWWRFDGIYQR